VKSKAIRTMKAVTVIQHIKTVLSKAGGSLLLLALTATATKAQLHPMGSVYFQNRYLINPAMAGHEKGWFSNLAFRRQWSSMPGSPTTQGLNLEYGSGKKSGAGLSFFADEAGLQKKTTARATYAYHLPINGEDKNLSFGLSLGYSDDRIMQERLSSNVDKGDYSLAQYYQRETYFDGDFGVAYQSSKLNLEFALPNMKSFFNRDENQSAAVDQSQLFAAASYKFFFPSYLEGMGLEPKVCFRQVKNFKDMVDIGANATLAQEKVNIMAMYHSTRSTTIGLGVKYQKYLVISGIYTSGTYDIREYANGNFELNLRVALDEVFKGKK